MGGKLVVASANVLNYWTRAWVGPVGKYTGYPIRNEIIYRTDAVVPVGGPVTLPRVSTPESAANLVDVPSLSAGLTRAVREF